MGLFKSIIFAWSIIILSSPAYSEQVDCSGNDPLLVENIEFAEPFYGPVTVGEWKLPISSIRPDLITDARVRLEWSKTEEGRGPVLLVHFTFPDPKPIGIPFSFEKAELTWVSGGQSHRLILDWSQECSGPGRSLFPRQAWSTRFELGSEAQNLSIERPVFKLWGSRN